MPHPPSVVTSGGRAVCSTVGVQLHRKFSLQWCGSIVLSARSSRMLFDLGGCTGSLWGFEDLFEGRLLFFTVKSGHHIWICLNSVLEEKNQHSGLLFEFSPTLVWMYWSFLETYAIRNNRITPQLRNALHDGWRALSRTDMRGYQKEWKVDQWGKQWVHRQVHYATSQKGFWKCCTARRKVLFYSFGQSFQCKGRLLQMRPEEGVWKDWWLEQSVERKGMFILNDIGSVLEVVMAQRRGLRGQSVKAKQLNVKIFCH